MKKKILIVEDDDFIIANMLDLLAYEGFEAIAVPTGAGAIERVNTAPPDLILCDVLLPGIDGYEVLSRIRQNPQTRSIPFAFVTANSHDGQIRAAMSMGADGYLVKPFKVDDLLKLVRRLLEPHSV